MRSRNRRRGAVLTAAARRLLRPGRDRRPAAFGPAAARRSGQRRRPPPASTPPATPASPTSSAARSPPAASACPWATFEQQTAGAAADLRPRVQGRPMGHPGLARVAEHRPEGQEAEAPSIDFAGAGRTVPWVVLVRAQRRTSARRRTSSPAASTRPRTGLDPRGPGPRARPNKVPSLNIHTDRDAENPAVVGGAAVAGNDPVPWVAWQERDGGADNATSPNQIFVSRGDQADRLLGQQARAAGTSVSAFCWQQVGIKRITKDAATSTGATDPTLNVDPTRDGIEPDDAFTGPSDTVPWVVWYEQGDEQASACATTSRSSPPRPSPTPTRRRRLPLGRPSAAAPRARRTCSTPAGPTASARARPSIAAEDAAAA